MANVYVSSTVADLRQERQAVMEWLVAAGHQPVHSYRPSSDTVRDSCLDDIDACDLYVLILGYRYGFQPEDGNPDGLSITQLEFRRAGQAGIPRIALLRTGTADVGLSDGEGPQKAALLAGFWAEVTGAVRAAEFGDLRGLVHWLSAGVVAELDKLFPAGRVLRLAPRPPFLAGREGLLAELEDRLGARDRRGPRVAVLHGLAGAGKTSVALEYAHRHQAEASVVWQLPAEDPTVLAAGFTGLAAALGAGEGSGDPVVAVHGALAAYRGGWLLVFDNAPDRAAVERFLPPAGQARVLITSRNALWPPGSWWRCRCWTPAWRRDSWSTAPATQTTRPRRAWPRRWAGCLWRWSKPPRISRPPATAWPTTWPCFSSGGRTCWPVASRPGTPGRWPLPGRWRSPIWRCRHRERRGCCGLLAFCAPDAVPLGLLLEPRAGLADQLPAEVAPVLAPLLDDELAARDAVAALRRYSLVRPAGDGAVSVHRLVQAVTADQMPADLADAWRQAAAAVVEAAVPDDGGQPEAWPVFAALLPHVRTVLALTSDGMWQVALYLLDSGSYLAARDLFQLIADAHSQDDARGAEHPDTLRTRNNLSDWTDKAGGGAESDVD